MTNVRIDGNWFKAKVLAKAIDQETIDACLLQVQNYREFSAKTCFYEFVRNKLKYDLSRVRSVKEGDTVYAVGYGYF